MIYIGIDPGQKGGLASIHCQGLSKGEMVSAIEMPPSEYIIYSYLQSAGMCYRPKKIISLSRIKVYIEKAQAMPKQGVVGVFNYGVGYGKLLACIMIAQVEYKEVRPAVWKKHFGLTKEKSSKLHSVKRAEQMFPELSFRTERGRLKDGMAEALLIAEYGRQIELKERTKV